MVLRTLETMGPLHGYGLARRIEQTSGDLLQLNYGTLYPALLKLEQEGYIRSRWGTSDNNRRAKFYELTKAGQHQVKRATEDWEHSGCACLGCFAHGERSETSRTNWRATWRCTWKMACAPASARRKRAGWRWSAWVGRSRHVRLIANAAVCRGWRRFGRMLRMVFARCARIP